MTVEAYRKVLLGLLIGLVVVAGVIPAFLVAVGSGCDRYDTCTFGIAVLGVGYLLVATLALVALLLVLLVVSMRRCRDTGLSGLVAIPPILLLVDLLSGAMALWQLRSLATGFDPTDLVFSLVLSAAVTAVFLVMLATMGSTALRDARSSVPLAFWAVSFSAALLAFGVFVGIASLVARFVLSGAFLFELFAGLQQFKAYYWFAIAKLVFVGGIVALMLTRGGSGGVSSMPALRPRGAGQAFGRRKS